MRSFPSWSRFAALSVVVPLSQVGCGGCNDNGVTRFNALPEATITSHEDGGQVLEGAQITLEGRISDPDDEFEELTVNWTVNGVQICSAPGGVDGRSTCDVSLAAGDGEVRLEAVDPSGGAGSDLVALDVVATAAPTVDLINPLQDGQYYADERVTFEARAEDEEDLPEQLVITWTSDLDGELDLPSSTDGAGVVVGSGFLSEGSHLLTVRVDDSMGKWGSDSLVIDVGAANSAPTCAISSPNEGATVGLGETLVFMAQASDPDVDAEDLSFTLTSDPDGLLASGGVEADGSIPADIDSLSAGDHLLTLVVVDDAGAECTDEVSISVNAPPAVEITAPVDGLLENEGGSVVFAGLVSDADDAPDTLGVSWTSDLDGLLGADPADASGVVGLSTSGLSPGVHAVTLSATDSLGGTADHTISVDINSPPGAPGVSISPDPANTGDDLVVSVDTAATDLEGATLSYSYTWSVGGSVSGGHTSSSVPAADTARGQTWSVSVVADDGRATGDAGTASITIGNALPQVTAATLSPTTAYTDDDLTVSASGSDADGESVSLSYTWSVNGSATGETGATLSSDWFDRGDVVLVTVTPNDGTDDGAVATATVTISNTPPVASTVTLSPASPTTDSVLTATASGSDLDGDAVVFSYAWSVDGSTIAATGSTLDGATWFDRGQTVQVTATPSDGADTGASVTSSAVMVANTAPEISAVTLGSTAADTDDVLTVSITSADDDSDTVSYAYVWTVSGTVISPTTSTLDGASWFDRGDTVSVSVTPTDGTDAGSAVGSNTVTIGNAAPEITSVIAVPATVRTDDKIYGAATGTDADGDTVTISLNWLVDGASVATGVGSISGTLYFDKGQVVYVVATPNDGTENGTPVASTRITIANTAPGTPVVSVSPVEPRDGKDDLVCVIDTDADDADGDSLDYTMTWTVDGVAWTGALSSTTYTDDTIPGTETSAGDVWECTATPSDGTDTGTDASASVTVIDGFNGWTTSATGLADADVIGAGEDASDQAGWSVSTAGDVDGDGLADVLVGAPVYDDGGSSLGAAYLYLGANITSGSGALSAADYVLQGQDDGDKAGYIVRDAGDVDNDGLADLLIGAPGNDNGGNSAGAAYLVLADNLGTGGTFLLADADMIYQGESSSDFAGFALAGIGDVDGDGLDDLAVGAYGHDDGGTGAGGVFVFLGSGADPLVGTAGLSDADAIWLGGAAGDAAGKSVAGGEDVDGDGYDDFIVGAPQADDTASNAGAAYLVTTVGSGVNALPDADVVFTGEAANDLGGWAVEMPGDVDADGFGDVLISASEDDSGGTDAGKVHLFFADSISGTASFSFRSSDHAFLGDSAGDAAGYDVRGIGDLDGDGADDFMIGAPEDDTVATNSGVGWLVLSEELGTTRSISLSTLSWSFTGEANQDKAGTSVGGAGDVNGDGLPDLLVGAPMNDDGGADAGKVYMVFPE